MFVLQKSNFIVKKFNFFNLGFPNFSENSISKSSISKAKFSFVNKFDNFSIFFNYLVRLGSLLLEICYTYHYSLSVLVLVFRILFLLRISVKFAQF